MSLAFVIIAEKSGEGSQSVILCIVPKTPVKKIENMVMFISEKNTRAPVCRPTVNNSKVEEPEQIANTIAANFSYISSSNH